MGFPFTLNANVWTESQFQNGDIAKNLGPFLYDLLKDRHGKNYGTSTSSKTFVTGSTVFTTQAGKKFAVGLPVMIASTASGSAGAWMLGYVTSYVGLSLTVDIVAVYPEAGSVASWVIFPGHYALSRTSPLPTADGGLGTATADTARSNVGLYLPTHGMSLAEDFTGYHRSLPSQTETSQVLTAGTRIAVMKNECLGEKYLAHGGAGGGRVTFDGNVSENIVDGNHPGIAVLRATLPGSCAFVAFGHNYFLPTSTPYVEYKTCIYLPNGLANASSDRIKLAIGFARHRYIDPGVPNDGSMTISDRVFNEGRPTNTAGYTFDTFNNFGYVLTNGEFTASDSELTGITNQSGSPAEGTISVKTALPSGRWLSVRIFRYSASTEWNCQIWDDYGNQYLGALLTFDASAADSNRLAPFVAMKKVNGSVERKVLVDYLSLRCETSAR